MSDDEPAWQKYVEDGKVTGREMISAIGTLSDSQMEAMQNYVENNDVSTPSGSSGGLFNPIAAAVDAAVNKVISVIVTPLFKGFYFLFALLAAVVGVIFLGSDLALGSEVNGFPGLADLPVLAGNLFIDALAPVGSAAIDGVGTFNSQMIALATGSSGIAAAPLLVLLQALEFGLLLYLAMLGYSAARSTLPIPLP